MIMKPVRSKYVLLILFICLIGFVYGCAALPNNEIADADAALNAAREAGAHRYVSEIYMSAESKLKKARDEVKGYHYLNARTLAVESKNEALTARDYAQRVKMIHLEEAKKIIRKAKDSLSAAEIAGAERHDPEDHRFILSIVGEAETALSKGDFENAYRKGEIAYQRARRLELATKRAKEIEMDEREKEEKN